MSDWDPLDVDAIHPRWPERDRQGNPISMRRWSELCQDPEYAIVAQEKVGWAWVSTVWLGISTTIGSRRPLIFETMVFADPEDPANLTTMRVGGYQTKILPAFEEFGQHRYATEAEALAGHDQVCAEVREFQARMAAEIEEADHE